MTTLTGELGRTRKPGLRLDLAGGRTPTLSEVRVEIQQASEVVADVLRLEPGAQLVGPHQQRFIDNIPWSMQTTFYP